jgi:hypothetical protein
MRRFKLVYGTAEFSIVYGKSLPLLLQEWRRSLDRFRFGDVELEKAVYLFKRQSIFGKECARVIAGMNADTRKKLASRQFEDALNSAEKSLGKTVSTEAVYQKMTALVRLSRYSEAIGFARSKLADSTSASSFLTLKSLLADALWGADSLESAAQEYRELLHAHLSQAWDESLSLRQVIVLKPELARALKPVFLSSLEDSVRSAALRDLVGSYPSEPMFGYLAARDKIADEHYEEAMQLLDRSRAFDSPVLELSRLHRLAQAAMALGFYQKSKLYYWQSLNHVSRETQSLEIEEKLRFCDWMDAFGRRLH